MEYKFTWQVPHTIQVTDNDYEDWLQYEMDLFPTCSWEERAKAFINECTDYLWENVPEDIIAQIAFILKIIAKHHGRV